MKTSLFFILVGILGFSSCSPPPPAIPGQIDPKHLEFMVPSPSKGAFTNFAESFGEKTARPIKDERLPKVTIPHDIRGGVARDILGCGWRQLDGGKIL